MRRFWQLLVGWFFLIKNRRKGIRVSPITYVSSDCSFEGPNYIDRFCNIQKMRMGRYSYIGYGSTVYGANIGRFCSIASGVKIGLGSHPVDMVSTSPLFYSQFNAFREDWVGDQAVEFDYKEVVIGHDVWIGANAIVMSGVKIGHGAVIAAGAVVTKDVLPYSIVGGVPARLIRNRFSAETIKAIEATNWWRKDCDELKNLLPFFKNVSAFVQHEYYPKYSNED